MRKKEEIPERKARSLNLRALTGVVGDQDEQAAWPQFRASHCPDHQAIGCSHPTFTKSFEQSVFSPSVKHKWLVKSQEALQNEKIICYLVQLQASEAHCLSYKTGLIWSQLNLWQSLLGTNITGLRAMGRQSCYWDPTQNLFKSGLRQSAKSRGTAVALHPIPASGSRKNCCVPR